MVRRSQILLLAAVALTTSVLQLNKLISETEKNVEEFKCKPFKTKHVFANNHIWQVMETSRGRVSLLNAYLDTRLNRKVVRINALGPNFNETFSNIHCQFWFDDGKVKIVRVFTFINLWITASHISLNQTTFGQK
jgi:hypothetical protein